MNKLLTALLFICLLMLTACGAQDADSKGTKTMKLAVVTPEERSLTQGLYKFQEIVEAETEGSIKIQIYPNGQLGGDREVLEGLQIGTIEGTTISTGPIAQFAPRFSMFDLPFLFPTADIAYDVLDGTIGTELLEDLPDQGIVGLNYWENGFRHVTNNVKEITSIDDLRGLKLRTLENELHIDMWRQLGTNPTPMAFTELFAGLQQGVVDGQENPVGNVTTSRFYEVQNYLTKTNHVYNASVFMISKGFWNTLSEEEQLIISEAADEARDYQRKLNQKEDKEAFVFLEKSGMTISEFSVEELQKGFKLVQPVYEKYSTRIGEELLSELLEAVQ
ncbi:DctP family TRAP transporter solute-binding subunit [Halalkalibacter krulwichiae]|uniref:C4-dicarboxylate-binding periplasmic protein n=1 Tax=Halalkalibacter krulwichiae TaxID=199441 RepID=A0A1X9MKN5_9BACI|nr:DctP family TRAP transporter solute-binding subunit [Halalkalibacter krulwichiae]ARK31212.1 C4-dicarboxylate-binding periplasmic protein precursor [Halalkalibacter krulwichiae]